jgi:hypothetical protein
MDQDIDQTIGKIRHQAGPNFSLTHVLASASLHRYATSTAHGGSISEHF